MQSSTTKKKRKLYAVAVGGRTHRRLKGFCADRNLKIGRVAEDAFSQYIERLEAIEQGRAA